MKGIEAKLESIIKPTRVNYINLYRMHGEHLSQFKEHNLTVVSYENIKLNVIFLENNNKEEGSGSLTVIYNHSHGSCKYEASNLIKHCYDYGMNLCLYDSRGCGRSDSDYIYFGFKEHIDLLYIVLELNLIYNCHGFLLWGRSIGCNTILQFYQTLIANESSFLNKIYLERKKNTMDYTAKEKKLKNKYPDEYNQFIFNHLHHFLKSNRHEQEFLQRPVIDFVIYGLILDSPYKSFSDFISDNTGKVIKFMPGVVSKPIGYYLKNFYNKRLGIDLNKKQNSAIIEVINVNTIFLVSDRDEIVPKKSYDDMVENFAKKCPKRNECRVYNTNQRHGEQRKDPLLSNCFTQIISNIKGCNIYRFKHVPQLKNKARSEITRIKQTHTDTSSLSQTYINKKFLKTDTDLSTRPSLIKKKNTLSGEIPKLRRDTADTGGFGLSQFVSEREIKKDE